MHAGRKYLQDLPSGHVLLKLDFKNAFNSIRHDKMLEAVRDLAPDIYPLVNSAYSAPSSLLWGESTILSAEGVQQGDPLGPLLFCLTLHRHCEQLNSPLCVMYLDGVTVGGTVEDVLRDLEVIREADVLGLTLNNAKSEIICEDHEARGRVITALPGAMVVDPQKACLLGSPLEDVACIDATLEKKIQALNTMGARFPYLSSHDALTLLRHSFAIPKLHYLLRSAPCFLSGKLAEYDSTLRAIISSVTNTPLTQKDEAWLQATLPVRFEGLGVRSAAHVAPSAYLSSTAASADLVSALLPESNHSDLFPFSEAALARWSEGHSDAPPTGAGAKIQKNWDGIVTQNLAFTLLQCASDDLERTRLLAAIDKDSGAWLQALPLTSVGLRMDDSTLRIAVGLRLGTPICTPHICQHCGAEVLSRGTHGLSCRSSEGRHPRHAAVNDIIHRTLSSAGIKIGWQEARWGYISAMEFGKAISVGCYLPRHFCPIPSGSCHPKCWVHWRASGGEDGREVRPLSPGLPFPASSDRDLRSYWVKVKGLPPRAGEASGVRLDRRATSSRDSLWLYSVGMLRLSWDVPPAQVEPTPFINSVCVMICHVSKSHMIIHNIYLIPLILCYIIIVDYNYMATYSFL